MSKKEDAEGFYNDGITYLFKDSSGLQDIRPRHIHFVVRTETASEMESCDVRFYSVDKKADEESDRRLLDEDDGAEDKKKQEVTRAPAGPNDEYLAKEFSDVAFFRLGYFDYAKLNVQNMLQKYEGAKEYAVDLLMDWDEQRVSIYINEKEIKSASFFTQRKDKLESANALSLYGLSPGSISKFKDVRVCQNICSPESAKEF